MRPISQQTHRIQTRWAIAVVLSICLLSACVRLIGGLNDAPLSDSGGHAEMFLADGPFEGPGPADGLSAKDRIPADTLPDRLFEGETGRVDLSEPPPPTLAKGELDTSFGDQGQLFFRGTAAGRPDWVGGIAVDSAGRLALVGSIYQAGGIFDIFLVRLLPDGTPDTTFGNLGQVHWSQNRFDLGRGILAIADDGLVISGSMDYGGDSPTIWQYTAAGDLDGTFAGGSGTNHIPLSGDAGGMGLARDPIDGGYYMTGGVWNGSRMHVVKFTAAGVRDTSFAGGAITTPNGFGNAVGVDSQRRVVVVGYRKNSSNDLAVWRYLADGSLDSSFATGGLFVQDGAAGGTGSDVGHALVLSPNDDALVAGSSDNGTDTDLVVWKLAAADGALEASFGQQGMVLLHGLAGGQGADAASAVLLDAEANIVVAGQSAGATHLDLVLLRLLPTGSLDNRFGIGGILTVRGEGDVGVHCIARAGHRLLVGGTQAEDALLWVIR